MCYAAHIVKEAGIQDIKQDAMRNLRPGASGGGIWDFIRSMIYKHQDSDIVRSLTNKAARGEMERSLFNNPKMYNIMRRKDSFLGKMMRPFYSVNKTYKANKELIDSIDTSDWGKNVGSGLASFNRQMDSNQTLKDLVHSTAKRKVFNTWEEASPVRSQNMTT